MSEIIRERNEESLQFFLLQRWTRIRNVNNHYLQDFTNPANEACIGVANILAEIVHKPYLILLMPTLAEVPPIHYTTSSYEEPLKLQEIVLNDTNDRLIHILDALDNAQEDAKLKHNSLFQRRDNLSIQILSTTEKSRVLSRHPAVATAFDAIEKRVVFKLYGDTVGAALHRLIEGLYEGSVNRTGQETDAGPEALLAIIEFSGYLQTLGEVKETLMSAGKTDRFRTQAPVYRSVKNCWGHLAKKISTVVKDENPFAHTSTSIPIEYCVKTIANDLSEILAANTHLYDLMSYEGPAITAFSEINGEAIATRAAAERELQSLITHACYSQAEDVRLCLALLSQISTDELFHFDATELSYLMGAYATAVLKEETQLIESLKPILMKVSQHDYPRLIVTALNGVSDEAQNQFLELTGFQIPLAAPTSPLAFFTRTAPEKHKAIRSPSPDLSEADTADLPAKRAAF